MQQALPRQAPHLCGCLLLDVSSHAPDLLKLHPHLVEGFSNDGNENILHQPREEEDHGGEEEGGSPARQGVNGPVHDEHPALLRGSLIHREDARG